MFGSKKKELEDQKRQKLAKLNARIDDETRERVRKGLEGFDARELEIVCQVVSIVHLALQRGDFHSLSSIEEECIRQMINEKKKVEEE